MNCRLTLCVATKILNLKAIPSHLGMRIQTSRAVRCNKNTKSESYSQYASSIDEVRRCCALQQKY